MAVLMTALAVAQTEIAIDLDRAFAGFVDFSYWDLWMPKLFRPISGPARALREGDRMLVGLGRSGKLTSRLRVKRLRPNKEICWEAGVPGLLVGEHSFFFAHEQGVTKLRSEEPFRGLLTLGPIGRRIEQIALETGEAILSSFVAHVVR
jgi:hypothetical protein